MKRRTLLLLMFLTLGATGAMNAQRATCDPITIQTSIPWEEHFTLSDWPYYSDSYSGNYNVFGEYTENCWYVPYTITADNNTHSPRLWYNGEGKNRHLSLKEGSSSTKREQFVCFPVFSNPISHLAIQFKGRLNQDGTRNLYIGYYNTTTGIFTQLKEVSITRDANSYEKTYGFYYLNENGAAPADFNSNIRLAFRYPEDAEGYSADVLDIIIRDVPNVPLTISSDADWEAFCNAVNSGYDYSSKTVSLTHDITVSTMAGTDGNRFKGTFDGQGYKMTLALTASENICAPFRYTYGATIKNLKVEGTVSGGTGNCKQLSGLVGYATGGTIQNCVVDATITTGFSGDSSNAGFVVQHSSGTLNITGCAFTGTFDFESAWKFGGFVGWRGNTSYIENITNCLFNPTGITYNTNSDENCSQTFVRSTGASNSNVTINNSYYTTAVGNSTQGTCAYTVSGETGVTVAMNGEPLENQSYDASGLSFYSHGLTFNDGNTTTVYAAEGDEVSLNLTYANAGSGTVNYTATYGDSSTATLTGSGNPYTLTMPAGNTTINFASVSYTNEITGYGNTQEAFHGNAGYRLIASPIGTVNVSEVNYLTSGTFNLYYFDQANGGGLLEWVNYDQGSGLDPRFNTLESGKGYLYANQSTVNLTFTGTPYSGNGQVTLSKTDDVRFSGWNLVGNPRPVRAYPSKASFYIMNSAGNGIIAADRNYVDPMEGIFVIAEQNDETMTFLTEEPQAAQSSPMMVLNIYHEVLRGNASVIDRAIVSFNEGHELPKFQILNTDTKLYILQSGKEYAVVHSQAQGELPVSFKAEENGRYTLSASLTDVEMDYLHLIDNLTGADVDLLVTPTYTFNARTTDYASRFKLVFASVSEDADGDNENFAFFSNGSWVINNEGDATLQVVDVMGRVLSSETINGATTKAINTAQGIYMLRLINGENVKVQKVVVR